MDLRRLQWCLRTLGPDVSEWPDHHRHPTLLLLQDSAQARQLLADALECDASPTSDAAGLCRMQARVQAALRPLSGMRWGLLAACAIAGLLLGIAADLEPADLFALDLGAEVQVASLP